MNVLVILITLGSTISLLMISLLLLYNSIISKKTQADRAKSSPFECGFDPKNTARLPFSMHFLLVTVIFLIFDVEITLLIPMTYTLGISDIKMYSLLFIYFLLILLGGVYHEWKQGALTWAN